VAKRILQIIPTLVRGGAEKQLTLLATGLPQSQYETQVCVLTGSGPYRETLEQAQIPVHEINKNWKLDISAYYRLKKLIKKLKPDLVHTWIFAANSYGRYAALNAGVKKIIAGERCVDPWKRWHEFSIDRFLAKRTNGIVTNSTGVVDFYVGKGIEPGRFSVITNGVERPDLRPVSEMRRVLLDALQLPPETRLIGTVGRLWPQKRTKDLIWAADLLKCIRDDVHLLIVGDGPMRWRLEKFREQVEITDRVHFLGDRPDAQEIISCLDCFWLGSDYEGQSNAVMEAMARGVPVVATKIPGNADLVIDSETGFLVEVGDRAAFAQKTDLLFNDDQLATKMKLSAIERMEADFSIPKMVSRYVDYYDRVLAE
jgi:glycosyltransferase involved in cell wall biosynthesis